MYLKKINYSIALLFSIVALFSCNNTRRMSINNPNKILIGESNNDWLKYKVFMLPIKEKQNAKSSEKKVISLNIMIINIMDNASPLRKRSKGLDEYNTYYEYLLNRCKNDIYLVGRGKTIYPVSYSFENNYNAFPFESINIGYRISRKITKYKLMYIDRVFLQDTVSIAINL